jgi:hypothetical protein
MDRKLQEAIAGAEIFRAKRAQDFGYEDFEPFYEHVPKGKMKPDAKAIAAFDAMVASRPLAPPTRVPREASLEEKANDELAKVEKVKEVLEMPVKINLPRRCSACGMDCDDCGGSKQ